MSLEHREALGFILSEVGAVAGSERGGTGPVWLLS